MANIHAIAGRLNGREAFLHEKSEDRHNVVMTIDDVEHYSNDEKKKIIASYPPHEAEARIKGIPVGLWSNISRRGGNHCHRQS
ncbi:MAG: hypothetical protein WAK36_18775 [Pseudolabrys sp.]